ncbi:MAG TPA: ABC transporter ATP-binding protein [Thermotogota bacterium]|nr:ABC transporter ATP-binding protein [Thermotogota bacterium]
MDNNIAIALNQVNVSYGSKQVLSDISVNFPASEMTAIIGPNGGGKTTLLKVICGLIKIDSGEISIFGEEAKAAREKGWLGYVPQAAQFDKLFPIKVEEVILTGTLNNHLIPFKKYSMDNYRKSHGILEQLGLLDLKDRQIGHLSGGQLQKVLIGRALVKDPKILLLDEPTASIDTQTKNQIYQILHHLVPEITIIIVTHDIGAISSYFDTVACLNRKIHYHGTDQLTQGIIDDTFGCPVDLIAHGIPHRVFKEDKEIYHD